MQIPDSKEDGRQFQAVLNKLEKVKEEMSARSCQHNGLQVDIHGNKYHNRPNLSNKLECQPYLFPSHVHLPIIRVTYGLQYHCRSASVALIQTAGPPAAFLRCFHFVVLKFPALVNLWSRCWHPPHYQHPPGI